MRHWTIDPADARNVRVDTDGWIAKFRLASDAAAAVRAYNSACGERAAIAAELAGGLNAPDAAEAKGYRDGLAAAEAYLLAQAAQIEDAPTAASPDQASQAISYLTAAAALGAWV
ncbi:MAG: hypothetical protein R3184_03610, partial [Aurantimonas coralicida]|nr:hypothetical protein [Aurantimonas coralicida]